MRETGYYWVFDGHKWILCRWCDNDERWSLFESHLIFKDEDFDEIDEKQIKRESLIQLEINILSKYIEHPTKPGYKRNDIVDRIKELNKKIKI